MKEKQENFTDESVMKEKPKNFTDEFKQFYKSEHNKVIEFELNEYMTIMTQSNTPVNIYFRNVVDKYSYSKVYKDVGKVLGTLLKYLDKNINYTKEDIVVQEIHVTLITIGKRRSL